MLHKIFLDFIFNVFTNIRFTRGTIYSNFQPNDEGYIFVLDLVHCTKRGTNVQYMSAYI